MGNYLGTIIKTIRQDMKMTQAELARGICSPKQIYRIEANLSNPATFLINEISNRLNVNLLEYFPYSSEPNGYIIKHEIDDLNQYFHNCDYENILKQLSSSKYLNNCESLYVQQEVSWFKGAIACFIDVPYIIDEAYFINILKRKRNFIDVEDIFKFRLTPLEYRIINSLVIILLVNESFDKAKKMMILAIENYDQYHQSIQDSSYLRLIYNLSRLYIKQHDYESAQFMSNKGIEHCKNTHTTLYLSDLCNIYGRALYKQGHIEEGKAYLNHYITISQLMKPKVNYKKTVEVLKRKYDL